MTLDFVLLVTVGTLIATGVYLFLDHSLTRTLIGLLLMSNGVNLLILFGSGFPGQPPIWGREPFISDVQTDSLPQVFILTAIVVSMGMTALLLALLYRQYRYHIDDHMRDDHEDHSLAQRHTNDPSAAPDHDESDDPTTGRPTETDNNFDPASFEKPVTPPSNTPGGDGDDD